MIRPFDREALRRQFQEAKPFPFIAIEQFLEPEFAREVAASYPTYAEARGRGREFSAVNEKKKVQIVDAETFPKPMRRLKQRARSIGKTNRQEVDRAQLSISSSLAKKPFFHQPVVGTGDSGLRL